MKPYHCSILDEVEATILTCTIRHNSLCNCDMCNSWVGYTAHRRYKAMGGWCGRNSQAHNGLLFF